MIGAVLSKFFSMLMLLVFVLSILMLVLTFRKPKKINLRSLGIALAMSLFSMAIFSAIIGYQASAWIWLLMALIGGVIGWFWARTTQVYVENNTVMSRNSICYLVVWGGVFALNQLITITTSRPPNIAMPMLILSTFIVWGTNGNIIKRYFNLQPNLTLQPAGVGAYSASPSVASPAQPAYGYPARPEPQAASFSPQVQPVAPVPPVPPTPVAASPAADLQARFAALKADLDRGAISRDGFLQQVSELRFQDSSGAWWQITEDGQGWLKWDGSQWVAAEVN
jgi:hypothetical protein